MYYKHCGRKLKDETFCPNCDETLEQRQYKKEFKHQMILLTVIYFIIYLIPIIIYYIYLSFDVSFLLNLLIIFAGCIGIYFLFHTLLKTYIQIYTNTKVYNKYQYSLYSKYSGCWFIMDLFFTLLGISSVNKPHYSKWENLFIILISIGICFGLLHFITWIITESEEHINYEDT